MVIIDRGRPVRPKPVQDPAVTRRVVRDLERGQQERLRFRNLRRREAGDDAEEVLGGVGELSPAEAEG